MSIPFYSNNVPYVTTQQMIEVDRAMMEDFRIELIQMMENAGRNLAHLARTRFLGGNPTNKKVTVLAGTGGNGGGALVCARRLHNWGAQVQIFITKPQTKFTSIPAHQLDIAHQMKIPINQVEAISQAQPFNLIVDGIIGYSLKGAPHGAAVQLIQWANAQNVPILALDAPSGVDTTTGTVFDPAIQATATLTLALPKTGLKTPEVEACVGELYLADISVPPALYTELNLGLQVDHLFAKSDIIRLR